MKKRFLVLFALILAVSLGVSGFAVDQNSILAAAQEMVEGKDRFTKVNRFCEALDALDGLTLQTGIKNEYVAAFQSLLIESDFLSKGENDGIYGKKTAAAVSEFQRSVGQKPTGIATPATQFLLIIANSELEENEEGVYVAQAGKCAVAVWPDYSFFIGALEKDGDLDYGTYCFTTGDYYAGDFKNDYRHGKGTAYYVNGDIYVGDWTEDAMSGEGTYYFGGKSTGEYYEGQWANNTMNGKGVYVTANGKKISGKWKNNQHIGW